MRDVSLDVPSVDELRANIPDPERFRPQPKLVHSVEWRVKDDGFAELFDARRDEWTLIHPMFVQVHRTLDEGGSFETMLERALPHTPKPNPRLCQRYLREYLLQLARESIVDIPFEPTPDVFADRYERLRELGRGGMGIVHLCRDRKTGERVVVKHAWGWTFDIAKAERTMRAEAAVQARLDHPAVPRLVDTFEVRGLLHLVRGFADGASLHDLRRELPGRGRDARLRILAQLAEAFAHIHARGFVYLDSKPGNFILGDDGRLSILDFGVCRACPADGARLRNAVGSPGFAAPEVRKELRATPWSDQYSLGCILYFMATGHRPSRTWTHGDLLTKMDEAALDAQERRLVARMTASDPAARYPDMATVRAAIEDAEAWR